jgi:hypothetical protein
LGFVGNVTRVWYDRTHGVDTKNGKIPMHHGRTIWATVRETTPAGLTGWILMPAATDDPIAVVRLHGAGDKVDAQTLGLQSAVPLPAQVMSNPGTNMLS